MRAGASVPLLLKAEQRCTVGGCPWCRSSHRSATPGRLTFRGREKCRRERGGTTAPSSPTFTLPGADRKWRSHGGAALLPGRNRGAGALPGGPVPPAVPTASALDSGLSTPRTRLFAASLPKLGFCTQQKSPEVRPHRRTCQAVVGPRLPLGAAPRGGCTQFSVSGTQPPRASVCGGRRVNTGVHLSAASTSFTASPCSVSVRNFQTLPSGRAVLHPVCLLLNMEVYR